MTVYVLHRDVAYEFGEVLGVYSTHEKAEDAKEQSQYDKDDLSIFEFELDAV